MSSVFLNIVNMSISASWIVLAVLFLRLLLKKAPKWITVLLWGIVAIRLICPFSIESVMSLIPSAETISPEIMMENKPAINTGIPTINNVVNPIIEESFSPDQSTSVTPTPNPLQLLISIFSVAWIVGIAVMLAYTVISYFRVKSKIGTAVLLRDNIFQSEGVVSPFVLGMIKPRIYLPFHMNEQDMEHVIAHENAHIRRKDHLWKPFGFLVLTLHWFNPFIWLGYVLLCRDIELACDEKVVKELDNPQKVDYAQALLNCSVNRRIIAACPIAFGESGVKDRVKSVLNYKKPAFWIITVAIIASIIVAVCFLTDPVSREDTSTIEESNTSEVTDASEEINSTEKANDLEESYELKYGLQDVVVTKDYGVFQVDNTTPYQELITKTVDIHKFAQYFNPEGGRGIDEVMEFIGVECLRETELSLYSVHKVEQGGLLYIFYHKEPWRTEITDNGILEWHYVRERLSLSDFAYLEENVTTIEEAIQFNEVEQIYLNCYKANPMFQYEPMFLIVRNYLEDCLLDIKYDLVEGELVFSEYGYSESYDLSYSTGGRGYPYEARILDMDWVE